MHDPHGVHGHTGHGNDHGHGHGHGPAHGPGNPFTPAEAKEFQKSDRGAGAVIILLMTGIFLVGVALYGTIAVITR